MILKRIISLVFLVITLVFLFSNYSFSTFSSSNFASEQQDPNNVIERELSLKEALSLGLKEAEKKLGSNVKIFDVTSVDDKTSTDKDGQDGERHKWNITFVHANNGDTFYVSIGNGEITLSEEQNGTNIDKENLIDPKDISFDSIDVLNVAKKRFALQPGGNFARGYHFVISKSSDNEPILSVHGTDQKGYITRIHFNANTEEFIAIETKEPTGGGGFYKLKDAKFNLITERDSAVVGLNVTNTFDLDQTIAIWGYHKPGSSFSTPYIKLSYDNGENWEFIKLKEENVTKVWFSDNYSKDNIIYYSTDNMIKSYNNKSKDVKIIFQGKKLIDVVHSKQVLAVLTEVGTYISNDNGVKWNKVETMNNIEKINMDKNGVLYMLTNGQLYRNNLEDNSKINLPKDINIITEFKVINEKLLLYTLDSLWLINLETNEPRQIKINKPIEIAFFNDSNPFESYLVIENKVFELNIYKEGENFKLKEVIVPSEGFVTYLVPASNQLFLTVAPTFNWEIKGEIK